MFCKHSVINTYIFAIEISFLEEHVKDENPCHQLFSQYHTLKNLR